MKLERTIESGYSGGGLTERSVNGSCQKSPRERRASYSGIPKEINPNKYRSVLAMFEQAMVRYANFTAFYSLGEGLRYGQIDDQSRAFAAYLQQKLGVHKGDRIAIVAPNVATVPTSMIGAMRCGAAMVIVNPDCSPDELKYQLIDAEVETILISNSTASMLSPIVNQTDIKNIIRIDTFDEGEPTFEAITFEQCIVEGAALSFDPVCVQGDDLLLLQYPSDISDAPNGAMVTHRNVVANAEQFKNFMPSCALPGKEILVSAIPAYKTFGLMMAIVYFSIGAENHLVANESDIDTLVDTLAASRPTVFPGNAGLFAILADHPRLSTIDWSPLKLTLSVDGQMDRGKASQWQKITGSAVHEGYGMHSISPVISLRPIGSKCSSTATGLPLPSTDIKLLDSDGKPVSTGKAGEICVKGPQVVKGYWKKPSATAVAYTDDGYYKTGDLGVLGADGQLKVIKHQRLYSLSPTLRQFSPAPENTKARLPIRAYA